MKVKTNRAGSRLQREREREARDTEILEASAILKAFPELTYGEALRHACARVRQASFGKGKK